MTDISKKKRCEEKLSEAYLDSAKKIRSVISSGAKDYTSALSIQENMPDNAFLGDFMPDMKIRLFSLKCLELNFVKRLMFSGFLCFIFSVSAVISAILFSVVGSASLIKLSIIIVGVAHVCYLVYLNNIRFLELSEKLHENVDVILSMAPILCDETVSIFGSFGLSRSKLSCVALHKGETIEPKEIFFLCLTMLNISDKIKEDNTKKDFRNTFCKEKEAPWSYAGLKSVLDQIENAEAMPQSVPGAAGSCAAVPEGWQIERFVGGITILWPGDRGGVTIKTDGNNNSIADDVLHDLAMALVGDKTKSL
jgi:hypothetical protein